MLSATASFLESGIAEDVPTGVTPRKKNWDIPTSWARVQPREKLIEAFRQRGGVDADEASVSGDFDAVNGQDGIIMPEDDSQSLEGMKRSHDSATSLHSVPSSDSLVTAAAGATKSAVPTTGIPSLSTSQMRPKRSAVPGGKRGGEDAQSKIGLPPLGESGLNLPRRVRK